ncbi:MAG: 16S rRNA (guanine(966)-N(2))-methyltransferase RsmD [Halioglobus sp.]
MARSGARGGSGQLRIIGGEWRGRRLRFTPAQGLRPTSDRTRETLFNWLAPIIRDAMCLDLFAGSGALGLEALSRGAAHCDFVEPSREALAGIRGHLALLQATGRGHCHQHTAEAFLSRADTRYDLAFIDPPFGHDMASTACRQLAAAGLLTTKAMVYVETAASEPVPEVPANWLVHREKTAGGVAYRLYTAGT